MTHAYQLLKWAIPGWIFIGLFLFLIKIDSLLTDNNLLEFLKIAEYFDAKSTGFFLFIGTSGIPIGYLIYQIYYFLYWTLLYVIESEISDCNQILLYWKPSLIVDVHSMQQYIKTLDLNCIMNYEIKYNLLLRLFKKGRIHNIIKDTITNYYHWVYIKKIWHEKFMLKDEKELLVNRMTFLNDIYDSLGATYVAILFASSIVFGIICIKMFICYLNTDLSTFWVCLSIPFFSFIVIRSNRVHVKRNIFILYKYMMKKSG
jgi:hypothetical protein